MEMDRFQKYRQSEKGQKYYKEYRASKKGKKQMKIGKWKSRGLIETYEGQYNIIYDRYINAENCELCHKKFKNSQGRHMDHNHTTGEFRHICCNMCNINMPDLKMSSANKTGYRHISQEKRDGSWAFQRSYMGKRYRRVFKSKIDCLCFKFYMILKINLMKKNNII